MTVNENRYILTAMDYLSKWPIAKAVPNITAITTVGFLYNDLISVYGCYKRLISDQESNFKSEKLGIQHSIISAYHPQANGLVERFNKTLSEVLGKFTDEFTADWDRYIPDVLFAYRTTTKFSPFQMVYGRNPILPIITKLL